MTWTASDWGTVLGEYDATVGVTDAGAGAVSAWAPASGSFGTVTQGTAGNRPTTGIRQSPNGLNVLDFDGNDALSLNVTDAAQPVTLVAVLASDHVDGNQHQALGNTNGPGVTLYVEGNVWRYYAGTIVASSTAEDTGWHVMVGIFNGASSSLWLDGSQISTGNPGTTGILEVWIGATSILSAGWNGAIAHAVYYSGVVANVVGLTAALVDRWITVAAPPTAPTMVLTTTPGEPVGLPATPGIAGEWQWLVRDVSRERKAEIDDYYSARMVARFNQVGAWDLTLPFETPAVAPLLRNGAGILVTRNGETVFSGPVTGRRRVRSGTENQIVFNGVDDNIHLADRLCHPSPAQWDFYDPVTLMYSQAYDNRSGTCSTVLGAIVEVNAGIGAGTNRVVPGLIIGTDPFYGELAVYAGRWQNMLEELRRLALAGGDVGFGVVQNASNQLVFQTYGPRDLTGAVKFSLDLGTLAEYEYEETGPETNFVVVAGSGEDVSRKFWNVSDQASIAKWGRRVETLRDRRDTADVFALQFSGQEEIREKAEKQSLSFVPLDQSQMVYFDDYRLGDQVTAIIDEVQLAEVLREVEIAFTAEDTMTVNAKMGTPNPGDVSRLFREVRSQRYQIRNLERR